MAWKLVGAGESLQAGDEYRLSMTIRAPYNRAVTEGLSIAMRVNASLKGLTIKSITHAPPLFSTHTTTQPTWPFVVTFTPKATPAIVENGLDPKVIWALTALVVTSLLALAVTSQKLEKLIVTTGDTLRDLAEHTVFNPGVLVLAVVGIYLITRRST